MPADAVNTATFEEVVSNPTDLISEETRDKAKEAVRKAIKAAKNEESDEVDQEQDEAKSEAEKPAKAKQKAKADDDGEPEVRNKPKAEAKSKKQDDDDEEEEEKVTKGKESDDTDDKLGRLSKERAKVKKIRQGAEASAQEARKELERQRDAIAEERDALRRERDEFAKTAEKLKILKRDPLRAMQELEVDPDDLLDRIAKDGTPEMEYRKYVDSLEEKVGELEAWRRQFEQRAKDYDENVVQKRGEERRAKIISDYLSEAGDEDRYPNLNFLYGDDHDKLVRLGHTIADEIRENEGRDATLADILAKIEENSQARISKRFGNPLTGKVKDERGLPMTLSKSDMSDRSSISVPDDLDERRRLAKRAVKTIVRRAQLESDD